MDGWMRLGANPTSARRRASIMSANPDGASSVTRSSSRSRSDACHPTSTGGERCERNPVAIGRASVALVERQTLSLPHGLERAACAWAAAAGLARTAARVRASKDVGAIDKHDALQAHVVCEQTEDQRQ